MIKTTRFKNIFRTITGTLNRFFAITAIVALGAGFLGGLEATSLDMMDSADHYMDKYNWYDIDVVNLLGFTQNEIEILENVKGIDQLQKVIRADEVFLNAEKKRVTMRIFGMLPENGEPAINKFELKKGHYPVEENECLVQMSSPYSASLPQIGDELTILEGKDGSYRYKTIKVAGIVQGPMFFSAELEPTSKGSGFLDMAIYLRPDYFIDGTCNHVYLTVKSASELDTWSEDYRQLIENTKNEINSLLRQKIYDRFTALTADTGTFTQLFDKAQDADTKMLSDEKNAPDKQQQVINLLLKKNSHSGLADTLLNEKRLLENSSVNATQFPALKNSVNALFQKFAGYKEIIFAVEDRNQNTGYASFKGNVEKIASLSKIFPVFFFFIALLVSLTTMTRLVEEKRTELGTLKSLGFSSIQLLGQYLVYAFISSLLGCTIGLIIGFRIFPAAVTLAYSMMYKIPVGSLPFRWNIAIPVSTIAIGVILASTAIACISETLARPAVLMAPKAPAPGKRVFLENIHFIWNKLNFSRKVTVRNMLRYKRRLWMTLAGVAGCSALLVTGFGLRDSLQDIVSIQYADLSLYNVSILVNDSSAFKEDKIVSNFLNDRETVKDWIKVRGESITVTFNEKTVPLTLYVPEDTSRVDNFSVLRTRIGHKPIVLDDEGIVICEKQTEVIGAVPGDIVTVKTSTGLTKQVVLHAQSECYLYSDAYMSPKAYEKLFDIPPEFNAAICLLTPEKNNQETVSSVMESPNVIYAMWIDSLIKNAHKSISSINIVVLVIIITSGLLSLIVLYNLTNINICERKREIATLLVLGYTEKEARKYIFREINLLSVIGTLIGLLLGKPLHALVVHATEVNIVMWGRTVHPVSYLYAFLVSIAFTVIVNLIMKSSITEIDMVESLKSRD